MCYQWKGSTLLIDDCTNTTTNITSYKSVRMAAVWNMLSRKYSHRVLEKCHDTLKAKAITTSYASCARQSSQQ